MLPKINTAVFVKSSARAEQCPPAEKPEYAFIGRSNVGKSSLINMLTGRKKLAKVSGSPGKTILINHFLIDDAWYLVDLPGYGFAKRSKTERAKWEKMIRNYLLTRTNLLTVFLLVDIRHEPQQNDLEFMAWLAVSQIPFTIVFTKADKLSKSAIETNLNTYRLELGKEWEELPPLIITSSHDKTGRGDVVRFIEKTNEIYQ